jgi:hypothetical protein
MTPQPPTDGSADDRSDVFPPHTSPISAATAGRATEDNGGWGVGQWAAVVAIGLALAAGIAAFFTINVCNGQLASNGKVFKVCRHLEGSDPPVIGIGVVLLAGLSVFFTEISGFGVTLKREVKAARETAQFALQRTSVNSDRITETEGDLADLGKAIVEPGVPTGTEHQEPNPELRALADEYNRIRLTMPSGSKRTVAMEGVVRRMTAMLADVREFDVERHLNSEDRGIRLAGFAYLYANLHPHWTSALVESLVGREDKPFGQYWALRALRKQCQADPGALSAESRRRLTDDLAPRLPTGSDRERELRQVLVECSG